MTAVDTNILLFAEVTSTEQHAIALKVLKELANGHDAWAIPWPCIYEFLRVSTHPRVFSPPVPMERALEDLTAILASPSLILLSETERHAEVMAAVLKESGVSGNLVFDARVAALCREHGVHRIVTGDDDFHRFTGLEVVNPFRPPS